MQARLSNPFGMTMEVMVLGHGNNGKSTFLNALLGQAVLPEGATPLTGNLTTVSSGTEDRFRKKPEGSPTPGARAVAPKVYT
jgi:ribosome biogenesis GTPase A